MFSCFRAVTSSGRALESHFKEDKKIEEENVPTLRPLPLHVIVGSSKTYGNVYRQHKVNEGFYTIPTNGLMLMATSRNHSQVVVVQSMKTSS
jgi:hypothetical protein